MVARSCRGHTSTPLHPLAVGFTVPASTLAAVSLAQFPDVGTLELHDQSQTCS